MSDLLGSFLSNFTKFLKMNANRSSADKDCLGFHDALERSLQQVGMGGKDGLCQYWQTSVLGHARTLEMEADEFRNTYLRLTVSCCCVLLFVYCFLGFVYFCLFVWQLPEERLQGRLVMHVCTERVISVSHLAL